MATLPTPLALMTPSFSTERKAPRVKIPEVSFPVAEMVPSLSTSSDWFSSSWTQIAEAFPKVAAALAPAMAVSDAPVFVASVIEPRVTLMVPVLLTLNSSLSLMKPIPAVAPTPLCTALMLPLFVIAY